MKLPSLPPFTNVRSSGHRPLDWGDAVMYGTLVLAFLFFLWQAFRWGSPVTHILINDTAFLPVSAAAVLLSLRAARHPALSPQVRRAWMRIAWAHLLFGLGDLLWFYWEALRFVPPFPSSADIFYLLSYPVLLWGTLTFPVRPVDRSEVWAFWLDTGMVALGGWAVLWYLVVGPTLASPKTEFLSVVLNIAYGIGDLIILVGAAAYLIRRWAEGRRTSVVYLELGALFTVAADVVYSYQGLRGTYVPGDITDTLWMVARCLYVAAGYFQYRQAAHAKEDDGAQTAQVLAWSALPLLSVGCTYITLWSVATMHADAQVQGVLLNTLAATALLVLRQVIVLRTNRSLLHSSLHLAEELRHKEARFRSLVQNASDAVLLVDPETSLLYAGPSFGRIFGMDPGTPAAATLLSLVCPEDRAVVLKLFQQLIRTPDGDAKTELRLRRGTAASFVAEAGFRNLLEDPDVGGVVVTIRDITEQKTLEEQLRYQAYHDSLTNLANRNAFRNSVLVKLARQRAGWQPLALLLMDLDGFKLVNDSLGHLVGDQLLVAVAQRLLTCVRTEDLVARLGGDEFAILMDRVDRASALQVAWRIIDALNAPFLLQGKEVFIRTSMGIALSAAGGKSADDLLREADMAMYAAKNRGKGSCEVFEPGVHTGAIDRLEVEADLRRAIREKELLLFYQPVISMATGAPEGFEALLRWQHPTRGLLSPGDFIPLAEETGLIFPIGEWVLKTALAQFRQWQQKWPAAPCRWISVNLSGQQLNQPELARQVERALAESGVSPDRLILEMTESVLVQSTSAVISRLSELKQLGVRLAIDDFGTGYSSLSYLASFPVDLLKIDRSFVQASGSGPRAEALLSGILNLARGLELQTIAEGVEEAAMLADLRRMGCEMAQGYYLSPPQPPEAFQELPSGAAPMPPLATFK